LSHELKTPLSILAASLGILKKRLAGLTDKNWDAIFNRAQRNLDRLLDMQYQIEDILREKDYKIYYMLTALLEACSDELESLVTSSLEEEDIVERLRRHIEKLFGPNEARSEEIRLDQFVESRIEDLRPKFAHRKCLVETRLAAVPAIWLPGDVLAKIIDGLVRNAIENTPDNGRVTVSVRAGEIGPELEVKDTGIGITEENQKLIFENYFTAYDTLQYSSRKPYDFGAGGKGFDLLRMRIFSERYHFQLKMSSRRCSHMPQDPGSCTGDAAACEQVEHPGDCLESGGTMVTVQFHPAEWFAEKPKES
jgi:signal transduction histidine kinase